MPIHPDWQPLLDSMMEQYCDGSSDETKPKGGPCQKGEGVFYAYCKKNEIDYTKPRPKTAEAFQWVGDIRPEEREGRYFIRGRAIHPCKTYHPHEWPDVRVYLEEELEKSAESLTGKPLLLDHCMELDPPNRVLRSAWEDGAVEYVAEVSKRIFDLVKAGEIRHVSVEYDWRVLEKLDGVAPRGLELTGLSLLRRLQPGDPGASVEVWEGIVSKLMEMRRLSEPQPTLEERVKWLEEQSGSIYERLSALDEKIDQAIEALNGKIDILIQLAPFIEGLKEQADETERERLHREQKERADKYGIEPKDGGNLTKPGEYEDIPEDQFADPVNWRYPVDADHVKGAVTYFNQPDNRKQYSHAEQVKIMTKIVKAALANDMEVSYQPEDSVYRDLPEDLKKQLSGYEEGGGDGNSGIGQDGEPRRGEPKTDEERLISHYGEEKARELLDLVGEDAYKMLPERGTGLESSAELAEAKEKVTVLEKERDLLKSKEGQSGRELAEAQTKIRDLTEERDSLKAKLELGEAVVEPAPVSGELPEVPGYLRAEAVRSVLPKQMWHGASRGYKRVVRELRSMCKKAESR